jgi:hypothetical protein
VRWLTGVHDAGDSTYVVCEPYEELLWWLQMPELLSISGQVSPNKSEVRALSARVHESAAAADKAGYRLQTMLGVDSKKPGTPTIPTGKEAGSGREAAETDDDSASADPVVNPPRASEELPVKPNR